MLELKGTCLDSRAAPAPGFVGFPDAVAVPFRRAPEYGRFMQCTVCGTAAGWLRRSCADCARLKEIFTVHRGADIGTMLELFQAAGVARDKVESFLASDCDGVSIRDHIAADMANDLLAAFGQKAKQTPEEVQRLRQRGTWMRMDRPPEE